MSFLNSIFTKLGFINNSKCNCSNCPCKGEKGERGEKGDRGDKGDKGEKGIDGINGLNGKDGSNGINGKDGLDGRNGRDADINEVLNIKISNDKTLIDWIIEIQNSRRELMDRLYILENRMSSPMPTLSENEVVLMITEAMHSHNNSSF